jgi:hypothetical protein
MRTPRSPPPCARASSGLVLVPGLLAAGLGSLIFLGLDSITGLGALTLTIPNLPPFDHLTARLTPLPGATGRQDRAAAPGSAEVLPIRAGLSRLSQPGRVSAERSVSLSRARPSAGRSPNSESSIDRASSSALASVCSPASVNRTTERRRSSSER